MAQVTVTDNKVRLVFAVGGTTTTDFAFPFTYYASTDITVYSGGSLVDPGDYTVNGNGSTTDGFEGGTVVLDTGVSNTTVIVELDLTLAKTTNFPISADFSIAQLNTEISRIWSGIQQINDKYNRSLKLSATSALVDGSGNVLDLTFSTDPEDGKTIVYDSTLKAFKNVNVDLTNLSVLAGIEDDITAVALIAADVTTVADNDANVTTLAGISSDVTTVAGISANVSAVAAIDTEIAAVGAIAADVTTVANNIGDIQDVADALAAALASGITVDDSGFTTVIGDNVQNALADIDDILTDLSFAGSGSATNGQVLIADGAGGASWGTISVPVTSVAGKTGDVTLDKNDVGLGNVANVDQQNASNLTSGTVGTARLGSGTANSTTFLRGDGTWSAAIPPTAIGAVGTYAFAQAGTAVTSGATTAGSNLTTAYYDTGTTSYTTLGGPLSGTWRNMANGTVAAGGIGLFVRTV